MLGHHVHVYIKASIRMYDPSQYLMFKESRLMWPNPFLAQDIYRLCYKLLVRPLTMVMYITYLCAEVSSRITIACTIFTATYYFCFEFWNVLPLYAPLVCQRIWVWLPEPFIVPTLAIISVLAAVYKCLLLGGALESKKIILKRTVLAINFANVTIVAHNQTF